jgi:hypothetical protein
MFTSKVKEDSRSRQIVLEENKHTTLDLVAENGEDDIDK